MNVMTPKEAAAYIGVGLGSLANWRSFGIGPAYTKKKTKAKGPPRVVYTKSAIDKWKKAQECPTCGHVKVHR